MYSLKNQRATLAVPTRNNSIHPLLHVTALEGHSDVTLSLNILVHVMNLNNSGKTACWNEYNWNYSFRFFCLNACQQYNALKPISIKMYTNLFLLVGWD